MSVGTAYVVCTASVSPLSVTGYSGYSGWVAGGWLLLLGLCAECRRRDGGRRVRAVQRYNVDVYRRFSTSFFWPSITVSRTFTRDFVVGRIRSGRPRARAPRQNAVADTDLSARRMPRRFRVFYFPAERRRAPVRPLSRRCRYGAASGVKRNLAYEKRTRRAHGMRAFQTYSYSAKLYACFP